MPINPREMCGGEETQVLVNNLNTRSHTFSHQVPAEIEREAEKWSINETEKDEISNVPLCRKQTLQMSKEAAATEQKTTSAEDENVLPLLGTAMWKINKVISVKME